MTNNVIVQVFSHGEPDSGDLLAETTLDMDDVREAAQAAADAADGDSNDEEIDLLRDALEEALHALGLRMPESRGGDE